MPRELRFCRNCGFRLGEGTAEYTETVRFQNAPPGTLPANGAQIPYAYGPSGGPMTVAPGGKIQKPKRRMSGMTWMFLGLLIFFIAAGVFTAVIKQRPRGNRPAIMAPAPPRSFAGVIRFRSTEGGVTFSNVSPPDGPADKAGLVGGDIITTVNGQPVQSDDDIMAILEHTPVGQTLDLVYLRDGETKNTKMTTISEEEMERLNEAFDDRPQGRGMFGYEDGDAERVEIPNTKMSGVRLNDVTENNPAWIAGIQNGDIVIEFGGVPIRTSAEFLARVKRAIPASVVDVVIIRNGARMVIPVKMGKA
jgi:membrane-associated protease RseP (regulator of RpoE activity)